MSLILVGTIQDKIMVSTLESTGPPKYSETREI